MKILGYYILPKDDYEKVLSDLSFGVTLRKELEHQITILKQKVDGNKLVGIIDVDIGDPTPDKPELRREYIAKVAGFYKDVLKSKCLQMISAFHKLLEEETNDRETDLYLKLGTFVVRDIMKWGDQAISEQMSYQTEPPPTAEEKKEAIAA